MKLIQATKEQAAEHYAEHKERPFFGSLVEFLSSGPMVCLAYEGKGVVAASRLMIGATNPLVSAPGTVRGDFGVEVDRYVLFFEPQSALEDQMDFKLTLTLLVFSPPLATSSTVLMPSRPLNASSLCGSRLRSSSPGTSTPTSTSTTEWIDRLPAAVCSFFEPEIALNSS